MSKESLVEIGRDEEKGRRMKNGTDERGNLDNGEKIRGRKIGEKWREWNAVNE